MSKKQQVKFNNNKRIYVLFVLIALSNGHQTNAQNISYAYSVSDTLPFGKLNPEASEELEDYTELIGTCDCTSIKRKKDKTWAEPIAMQWTFKYIMNGTAVQDETLKSDGTYSGSIRQFDKDSLHWYVHYYSSQNATPYWQPGKVKKNDEIVLYRRQKAPNGMDGYYKIRFYDISENGFKWVGAWTTKEEDFVYETWKIECKKRR